jgi:hypothetical protein
MAHRCLLPPADPRCGIGIIDDHLRRRATDSRRKSVPKANKLPPRTPNQTGAPVLAFRCQGRVRTSRHPPFAAGRKAEGYRVGSCAKSAIGACGGGLDVRGIARSCSGLRASARFGARLYGVHRGGAEDAEGVGSGDGEELARMTQMGTDWGAARWARGDSRGLSWWGCALACAGSL